MTSTPPLKSDPRARPAPFTFFPPKRNPLVISLVKLGIERAIRNKLFVTDIEISDDDLQRLRGLKKKRCLLTPSHSGGFEPHIIMYLSKLLDDDYNYVAAMELFQQSPVYRWLMPRLGVYSIIRGTVDRPSFSMTRKLLAKGKRWLVIFPEGQTIWQNSMVIPFQQGVIQLAFKGYEDAAGKSDDAHLYCIPMAIKYVYLQDMHSDIDASLTRLEEKLSIDVSGPSPTRYGRLRRVAESVLGAMERTHEVKPPADSDMNDRITALKEHAISRLELQLSVKPNDRQTLLDRIRALFNAVDRIVNEEPTGSEYEQQLFAERQRAYGECYEDLWRLLQFVSIYDGYVKESMTFERFLDVLCLMEMEVLRERRIWGPRQARVKVGEPVDLRDLADAYRSDRRKTVQETTNSLESTVRTMLEELEHGCKLVEDS